MFRKSLQEQFLDCVGDSLLGTIPLQPFQEGLNQGAPEIYVASMVWIAGDGNDLTKDDLKGAYNLQQGEDSVIITREQLAALNDLVQKHTIEQDL